MKKIYLCFTLLIFVQLRSLAQDVTIPDSIFKSSLVSNTLINTNFDTEIQVSEALAFTGGIYVGGNGYCRFNRH